MTALHLQLRDLVTAVGRSVVDDTETFRAALDDFLDEQSASRGELNLLVDAVRLGAVGRAVEQIGHGGMPALVIDTQADLLARDRGAGESANAGWAIAALGFALGSVAEEEVVRRWARSDVGGFDEGDARRPSGPPTSGPPTAVPPTAFPAPSMPPTLFPSGSVPPDSWPASSRPANSTSPPTAPTMLGAPGAVSQPQLSSPSGPPQAPSAFPVAAPPDGSPTAGMPHGYGPSTGFDQPPTGGSNKKTGLIAGTIAACLVLIIGAGVAIWAVTRGADDPTVVERDRSGDSSKSSDEREEPRRLDDPAAVEADLTAMARELFPSGSTQSHVRAHSWSVRPENLVGKELVELRALGRMGATVWDVRHTRADHEYWIYVENVAPDYAAARPTPGCDGSVDVACEELRTPDGKRVINKIFTYPSAGHRFIWIPGDPASGQPEITIGESISGLSSEPSAPGLVGLFDLSVESVLSALDDPRALVPLPRTLPPLPSYSACVYLETPPSLCPDSLE